MEHLENVHLLCWRLSAQQRVDFPPARDRFLTTPPPPGELVIGAQSRYLEIL